MGKIAVIARIKAKPQTRDEIEERLRAMMDVVAHEDGTEQYILHSDQGDPDTLWMYEFYTDMGALGAHSSSPELGELMALLGDAVAEPPLLVVLEPLVAKGVDL